MVKVRVTVRFWVQKDLGFDPRCYSEPFIWKTYHKIHERTNFGPILIRPFLLIIFVTVIFLVHTRGSGDSHFFGAKIMSFLVQIRGPGFPGREAFFGKFVFLRNNKIYVILR